MLVHRLSRRPNVKPASIQHLVYAGTAMMNGLPSMATLIFVRCEEKHKYSSHHVIGSPVYQSRECKEK